LNKGLDCPVKRDNDSGGKAKFDKIFLFEYNHLRRHGGLNYETPFDKLQKVIEFGSERIPP
jgi:hypothetical protein